MVQTNPHQFLLLEIKISDVFLKIMAGTDQWSNRYHRSVILSDQQSTFTAPSSSPPSEERTRFIVRPACILEGCLGRFARSSFSLSSLAPLPSPSSPFLPTRPTKHYSRPQPSMSAPARSGKDHDYLFRLVLIGGRCSI